MISFSRITGLSAVITLILSLILITPLCGFLFQCGCDWPGLGLDINCNYHKPHIVEKCSWCVLLDVGVLSIAVAILSGLYASMITANVLLIQQPLKVVLIRVLLGVTVFVLIATVAALPLMSKI